MKDSKEQLRWEIKVLRRALRNAVEHSKTKSMQSWIESAAMELTRETVAAAMRERTVAGTEEQEK